VASFQDTHPRAYYKPYDSTNNPTGYKSSERTSREHTLLHAALQYVKPQIPVGLNLDANADKYADNVCFVIKGTNTGWSELLWPHQWSLYTYTDSLGGVRVYNYNFQIQSMMNASVLCHEMGHTLGSPDFYRYSNTKITPVGSWDLMSNNSSPPQQMEIHVKVRYMKWLPAIPIIKTPGRYILNRSTVQTNNAYRIASPYSTTQYFVVEYRSKKNTIFEQSNEGLLVYRVDSLRSGNSNGPPDEIYVYRPGGDTNNTGTLANAAFSAQAGRTAINDWTDPWPFLSTQKAGGLNISNISARGDTIAFTLESPLPARIDSLAARAAADSVAVTWRTDGEYRCQRFDIQRATVDSTVFQTILMGSRIGAGTTTTGKRYSYGDRGNFGQKYYRLAAVDSSGNTWYTKAFRMTGTTSVGPGTDPATFVLEQNYPNPFNPTTVIAYSVGGVGGQVSGASNVKLSVYDLLGREVSTLVNERKEPGAYTVKFDAGNLPSGAYFYRLQAGSFVAVRKLVVLR
jgi:M6 family metalloprotease-like protein